MGLSYWWRVPGRKLSALCRKTRLSASSWLGSGPLGWKDGQRHVVPEPAGVVEEVAEADRRAVIGKLRQVFADVVFLAQPAVGDEQADRGGGELLRHGGDVEGGRGR